VTDIPPPSTPVLAVQALKKAVPGGRVLFENLTLAVPAGQVLAIMGDSGVGKSTLLNLIAGLDRADAGRIEIDGIALDALSDDDRTALRRDHIGFVFQAVHSLPHLALAQNIALPLVLGGHKGRDALDHAEAMLDQVGLGGRGDDFAAQLSGGELQRIAIGRALVHRPALILADEPTGNLDPETAERILALLLDSARRSGAAALIVTHSERAAAIADRTLILGRHGLGAR